MNDAYEDVTRAFLKQVIVDGLSPNGIQPAECGPWRNLVEGICHAYENGGTDPKLCTALARRAYAAMASADPDVAALLARSETSTRRPIHFDEIVSHEELSFPDFDLNVFPEIIREIAPHIAHTTQTGLEASACFMLACIAAAIQGKTMLEVGSSWTEPLCLYLVLVMLSGEGKGPLVSMLTQPFIEYEQALFRKWEKLFAAYEANKKDNDHPGPSPRLITRNFTVEELDRLMSENGEVMAILTSEGGFFDNLAGHFSRSGAIANIDLLLSAWSGEAYHSDRINKRQDGLAAKPMYNPRLSIACAVQPIVFEQLQNMGMLISRGLFARFLIIRPESRIGHRQFEGHFVPNTILKPWNDFITMLLETEDATGIPVHPEAFERVQQWAREIEPLLLGQYRDLADVVNKGRSNILRIAGSLLIADNHTVRIGSLPLTIPYVERAITIYQFAFAHIIARCIES